MSMRASCSRRGAWHAAGSVLVELAVALPALAVLVFGILELGTLFANMSALSHAAREAARAAALGASTTETVTRVQQQWTGMGRRVPQVTLTYRTRSGGSWSSWQPLGNLNARNNAPSGSQVRVHLSFDHELVTGALFARLLAQPGGTTVNLVVTRIARRE